MLRKNVSGQFIHVQGVDAVTGGIKTGVSWTVRRCIDGTFAAATGTASEDGTTGWYKFALSQADTNGNNIGFGFTGTGAVPQTVNVITTAADPTDSVRLGLTALPNAAAGANTGLPVVGTQIPNATAGAASGVQICGSNAATTYAAMTVTAATTLTGNVALADGLTIAAPSTAGRAGLDITGNGAGAALKLTGGATGNGATIAAGATSGHGIISTATGTSFNGLRVVGSPTTGEGLLALGGSTSGDGIKVITVSGHGVNLAPVGTNMHGILSTGGNGGTSDGIKAAAGTGGVDFRANQTGNLTGTVATLTTYTGNTPQTGDSFLIVKSGGSGDNAAIKTKTDFLPSITAGSAGGVFIAGTNAATTITTGLTTTFTGNLTGSVASVTGLTPATVHADLDDIQARLPAALTAGGNIKADALLLNGATPNNVAATDIVSAGAITTSGGVASADVKKVNAITVAGVGTAGNPWGP